LERRKTRLRGLEQGVNVYRKGVIDYTFQQHFQQHFQTYNNVV